MSHLTVLPPANRKRNVIPMSTTTTNPLTPAELSMAVDLFDQELLPSEMHLSFEQLHDLFDPNQLVGDSIDSALNGRELTPEEWLTACNLVAAVIDVRAAALRAVS